MALTSAMAFFWSDVEPLLLPKPHLIVMLALLPVVMVVLLQRLAPGKAFGGGNPNLPAKVCSGPTGSDREAHTGHSAAACWARGDGRLKHRMLRPEPYSPQEPPKFSLIDLPLPMPALAKGEAEGLEVLAASLEDLRGGGRRMDKATLLRFLRARKGNVSAAAKYFREAELYRDELGLQRLETSWNLEAYERCFAPWWARGGFVGLGLKGQVVGWECFGRCAFPQLLQALPWEVLQRLDAVHLTRILAALEEDALRRNVPVANTILVLDLEGLGWSFCTPKAARAYAKIVSLRDMLLPCSLGHVLVIRAPKPFAAAWSTFQHFLDPTTREKVQIAAGVDQSLALLRSYMGDETIPAYIGGSLKVDGDPECRGILGSSDPGPVPPEALRRLEAVLAGRGKESEQQHLREGTPAKKDRHGSKNTCCFGCLEKRR